MCDRERETEQEGLINTDCMSPKGELVPKLCVLLCTQANACRTVLYYFLSQITFRMKPLVEYVVREIIALWMITTKSQMVKMGWDGGPLL